MFRRVMPVLTGPMLALPTACPAIAHGASGGKPGEQSGTENSWGAGVLHIRQKIDPQAAAAPLVRVELGATVELTLPGAGDAPLHLRSHDIEAVPGPDGSQMLRFRASDEGRFPLVRHLQDDLLGRSERAVAYIEVLAP